ncbi:MAG: hypothetical protein ACYC27_06090 [Armatimonadota bacterium]
MYAILGLIMLIFAAVLAVGWLVPLIMGIIRLKKGVRSAGLPLTIIGEIWGFFSIVIVGFTIYGFTMMSKAMDAEDFDPSDYQKPMGMIDLSYEGDFEIQLRKAENKKLINFKGEDGTVLAPTGLYTPQSLDISMNDKQDREWIAHTYFTSKADQIQVTTDSPVSITAGPPFQVMVHMNKSGKNKINFDLGVKGSDGRSYDINCYEIDEPAGFVVLSKTGEKLWEGKFEAG